MDLRLVQPPLLGSPYCGGCPANRDCDAQHTQLACSELGPVDPAMLHYKSEDFLTRYTEVNGFELTVQARSQRLPELPSYIPAIRPGQWGYKAPRSSSGALAIRLADVSGLARRVRRQGSTAKHILGMSPREKLIVLGFASDRFLEGHWPAAKRSKLLMAIREIEPDAAVAWNYSVWHRTGRGLTVPRPDQMYNLKRSLVIFADMQAIGIPAIPHIYWGIPGDVDRWPRWFDENPAMHVFSVDLQTVDQPDAFDRALEHLAALRQRIGTRRAHAVLSGTCKVARVRELKHVWPHSSLANFAADYGSDRFRYKPCYGLARPWSTNPDSWTRQEVFSEIVRQYSVLFATQPEHTAILRSVS